ncbi:MAG: hypothetical protein LBQ63_01850 [Deltaproteobacteria bacterium]|nr:hypothetical protein [Deltaproteobacteria bacterium]
MRVPSNVSGLSLYNLHFTNVNMTYTGAAGQDVVNGLIGSDSNNTGDIRFGNIYGNAFTDLAVTFSGANAKDYLAGGGIIGLRATGERGASSASASMNDVIGNLFRNLRIHTTGTGSLNDRAYIEGGGIIGVDAVSSPDTKPGEASIRSFAYNLFTGINVQSDDILIGGGLVGVNNNSKTSSGTLAALWIAEGNIFGNGNLNGAYSDIYVRTGYSLRGGGVIGVNGLSNAPVRLDSLDKNIFAGIAVETGSYLKGGGIVGLHNNDPDAASKEKEAHPTDPSNPTPPYISDNSSIPGVTAYMGTANDNLFLNLRVDVGKDTTGGTAYGGYLEGGGIIGVRSNQGLATIDTLQNNIFKNLEVKSFSTASSPSTSNDGHLDGGGIVGTASLNIAALIKLSNNYFDDLRVNTAADLRGGGIVGASSIAASVAPASQPTMSTYVAELDTVSNNTFNNLRVSVGGNLLGGGLIGAHNNANGQDTSPYSLIKTFSGNSISAFTANVAGEISGGGVLGGHTGANKSGEGTTGSLDITNNRFTGVSVTSTNLSGGGLIGFNAASAASAYIDSISGNLFDSPVINTSGYISGGGVIGVRSGSGIAYIKELRRNTFRGARITAGSYIDGGGLLGAIGDMNSSSGQIIGIGRIEGSVFRDNEVRANNGQILGGAVYSYGLATGLTISDSQFLNNTFTSELNDSSAYTSGTPSARVYGTVSVDTGLSALANIDQILTLRASAGNSTIFRDNLIKDDYSPTNPRSNSLYFGIMDGTSDPLNNGDLTITPNSAESDAQLIVDPQAGGLVALYDPIAVMQDSGHTFNMNIQGEGEFLWGGENVFTTPVWTAGHLANEVLFEAGSTTTLLEEMTLNAVNHDFTLNSGGRINVMGRNALRIDEADFRGRLHFNLNATSVNDFNDPLLKIIHPLMATPYADIDGATVSLSNLPAGAPLQAGDEFYLAATDADENLAGEPANNRAYARQGLTLGHNFIIDKNPTKMTSSNRHLVARLAGTSASPESGMFTSSRAAALFLLGQNSYWLADHSYQQADLALRKEDAWTPFGGIDGTWVRADAGARITLRESLMVAGLATKKSGDAGSLLLGGFFEGGLGDYDVRGEYDVPPDIVELSGDGDIFFAGAGVMARLRRQNGLRLEASLRGGYVENEFKSRDFVTSDGIAAEYDADVPYFGAHAGLGYEVAINERHALDFPVRYYFVRQNGKSVNLPTGEKIHFQADNSHSIRAGARYTYAESERIFAYAGAAFEYGFDHRLRASNSHGYDLAAPRTGGPGGVGELGMIIRPAPESGFAAEFGAQGYVGERRGVSLGVRLGYEF